MLIIFDGFVSREAISGKSFYGIFYKKKRCRSLVQSTFFSFAISDAILKKCFDGRLFKKKKITG